MKSGAGYLRNKSKKFKKGKGKTKGKGKYTYNNYTKNSYKPKQGGTIGLGKQLFPDRLNIKMTYNFSGSLVSTSGSVATNSFKLNALWKPEDTTGGTTQPRYFDTMFGPTNSTAPYIGYRVYGANVVVNVGSNEAAFSKIAMGARDDNINGAPVNMRECSERPQYITKWMGSNQGANNVVTLQRYFDLSKIAGVNRSAYMTDDDFRGTWTTNPLELIKLDILASAINNQTRTFLYDMTIHFYVQCLYASDVQTEVS